MYPIENQVCTLRQARKFDELGLKLESYFVWIKKDDRWQIIARHRWKTKLWTEQIYPAFSCAEVGILLPFCIDVKGEPLVYQCHKFERPWLHVNNYETGYYTVPNAAGFDYLKYKNQHECHAKSDLLLHILRFKNITPDNLDISW